MSSKSKITQKEIRKCLIAQEGLELIEEHKKYKDIVIRLTLFAVYTLVMAGSIAILRIYSFFFGYFFESTIFSMVLVILVASLIFMFIAEYKKKKLDEFIWRNKDEITNN